MPVLDKKAGSSILSPKERVDSGSRRSGSRPSAIHVLSPLREANCAADDFRIQDLRDCSAAVDIVSAKTQAGVPNSSELHINRAAVY
jgi:hypothetical protein